jgi:hypothetical protein
MLQRAWQRPSDQNVQRIRAWSVTGTRSMYRGGKEIFAMVPPSGEEGPTKDLGSSLTTWSPAEALEHVEEVPVGRS